MADPNLHSIFNDEITYIIGAVCGLWRAVMDASNLLKTQLSKWRVAYVIGFNDFTKNYQGVLKKTWLLARRSRKLTILEPNVP